MTARWAKYLPLEAGGAGNDGCKPFAAPLFDFFTRSKAGMTTGDAASSESALDCKARSEDSLSKAERRSEQYFWL